MSTTSTTAAEVEFAVKQLGWHKFLVGERAIRREHQVCPIDGKLWQSGKISEQPTSLKGQEVLFVNYKSPDTAGQYRPISVNPAHEEALKELQQLNGYTL